jgi:hypothetical protein
MFDKLIVEFTILDAIFWALILGMIYQIGRELVSYLFHRHDENEKDS